MIERIGYLFSFFIVIVRFFVWLWFRNWLRWFFGFWVGNLMLFQRFAFDDFRQLAGPSRR